MDALPCTPVSGQQWTGNALANFSSPSARQGIAANVWEMTSASIAQASVAAFLAPAFGPGCMQPEDDAQAKRNDFSAAPSRRARPRSSSRPR